jgi:hypothetical protein
VKQGSVSELPLRRLDRTRQLPTLLDPNDNVLANSDRPLGDVRVLGQADMAPAYRNVGV